MIQAESRISRFIPKYRDCGRAGLAALLGAACLALTPGARAANPDGALTPEQTANLYMKALVNADMVSARAINERLRDAYAGKDALDTGALAALDARMARMMGERMLAAVPASERAGLKGPVQDMAERFVAASRRSRCQALSSQIREQATNPRVVATVRYTCMVPDLRAALHAAGVNGDTKPSDGRQYADMVRRSAQAFDAAPVSHRVEGSLELFGDPSRRYWASAEPDAPVKTVLGAMSAELKQGY
ncbi:hypothetical protein [Chitinasiproducens palmae]|uniref:Lipoprotein n=1 Tax=Chitinasiproducens palmae TaxID=1770053 RepID=A0A1H2PNM2_9BURK|nr:hypothetical protein [Chitinasiproducens palmae]SDV48292.1 hypothetical protein SAMN05216551_104331 [Chitinasiproducens palmae]